MWAARAIHKSAVEGKTFVVFHSVSSLGNIFLCFTFSFCLVQTVCFFFPPLHSSFIHSFLSAVLKQPAPEDTVTASFGKFISEIKPQHLSPVVLHRSKRMVLDSIGVGLIGSTTDVFELALQHCQVSWGKGLKIKVSY